MGRVDALCVPLRRKRDKWLDNYETCRLLNVSARTIQIYRDTGKLPYSQINNKIYYKASDVETFLLNQGLLQSHLFCLFMEKKNP